VLKCSSTLLSVAFLHLCLCVCQCRVVLLPDIHLLLLSGAPFDAINLIQMTSFVHKILPGTVPYP